MSKSSIYLVGDLKSWVVKNIAKVSGFLGSSGQPKAISEQEAQRILNRVHDTQSPQVSTVCFEIGEHVLVSDGPFTSFNGVVEEVDYERSRLKVAVSIFGRATPVDLEFSQVEKI